MNTWKRSLGRNRSRVLAVGRPQASRTELAKAAGVAWADREAEGVVVLGDWSYTWLEALPFVPRSNCTKTRRNLASIVNDSARARWHELAHASLSIAA